MNNSNAENADSFSEGSRKIDRDLEQARSALGSARHVMDVMRVCGFTPKVAPRVLAAACDLADYGKDSTEHLRAASSFFGQRALLVPDGLETIPTCWLKTLPELLWRSRKPHWTHLPYWMTRCAFLDGVLTLSFAQEAPSGSTDRGFCDRLRVMLNSSLSPNLWTKLSREQEREIWLERPELRHELFHIRDSFGQEGEK